MLRDLGNCYVYKPNFLMTDPTTAILGSIHLVPVAFNGGTPALYILNLPSSK